MEQLSNVGKTRIVTLEKYISTKPFQLGMRDYSYKLPPRELPVVRDQINYEKGRLFSAALAGRGENYKKYIRYNKIVDGMKDELRQIIIEDVKF